MCRLALLNKEGINYIESNYGLVQFFNYLEAMQGGHGNGYCIIYDNQKTAIKKGITLTNEEIAEDILKDYNNIRWVLYHTRLASMGNISNENCHPFKNGDTVLMMNGTERHIKGFIKDNKTDTETILNICCLMKISVREATKQLDSVFVGYEDKKVFANRNYGDLELIKKGKTLVFASEFLPDQYQNNVFIAPPAWVEGQKIETKTLRPAQQVKIKFAKNWYTYQYFDDDIYMYNYNNITNNRIKDKK